MWWFGMALAEEPADGTPMPQQVVEETAPARIEGVVIEFGSGLPLPGAVLASGDQTITADGEGRFQWILPAGSHEITIRAEEHVDGTFVEELEEGELVEVKYRLQRRSWSEEIVVYGEAREEIARQVISVEELRRVPGSMGDPIRALQSLPSVARGPELSGDIVARGAEARNTAAYIDGIRIPFVFHFLVGRSVVDPGQLTDLEFYPGAVPPEYGDVSQAVINARTASDRAEPGLHGQVHFDLLELGFSAATNLDEHWTLRVGGRRAWVGAIANAGIWVVREVRDLNEPDYRPPSLRVPYRDLQLRLSGIHGPDRTLFTVLSARDGIEYLPEWTDEDGDGKADRPEPPDLPYNPNLLLDSRFLRVQMRWDHTLERHRYSSALTVGRDSQQNLVEGLGLIGATGIQFARLEQGWFAANHREEHVLSDLVELSAGADVVVQPGTIVSVYELPSPDAITSTTRLWAGPYAEVALTPGDYRITPGLRVSFHRLLDGVQTVPEPRIGIRRALSDRWSLLGYTGILSQGPTLETAGAGFARGELSVLRAWQSSIGVEGRWPSGLCFDLSVFETEMYDLTVRRTKLVVEPDLATTASGEGSAFSSQARLNELPYYESVHGRAYGIEGQLRVMPRGAQFGWISASVGRSLRYPDLGGVYRSSADIPLNLVAVWGAGLGKDWTISGRGQISSGLVFTPEIGIYSVDYDYWYSYSGDLNADRYPLYKRFDLRVDKTWTGERARWTLYFDIYNALGNRNPLYATYDWAYQTLTTRAFIPILPTLGLEVTY